MPEGPFYGRPRGGRYPVGVWPAAYRLATSLRPISAIRKLHGNPIILRYSSRLSSELGRFRNDSETSLRIRYIITDSVVIHTQKLRIHPLFRPMSTDSVTSLMRTYVRKAPAEQMF